MVSRPIALFTNYNYIKIWVFNCTFCKSRKIMMAMPNNMFVSFSLKTSEHMKIRNLYVDVYICSVTG